MIWPSKHENPLIRGHARLAHPAQPLLTSAWEREAETMDARDFSQHIPCPPRGHPSEWRCRFSQLTLDKQESLRFGVWATRADPTVAFAGRLCRSLLAIVSLWPVENRYRWIEKFIALRSSNARRKSFRTNRIKTVIASCSGERLIRVSKPKSTWAV